MLEDPEGTQPSTARRRRTIVAVVLVVLLVLPAFSALVVAARAVLGTAGLQAPAGAATLVQADPGAGATSQDAAGFTDASRFPAAERLGRWDGSAFEPVPAGSIDAEVVTVISHGWAPGYRSAFDRLQAGSDSLVTAWDPRLVDGDGASMMEDFTPLAAALQEADPTSAVVAFSWIDQSATGTNPLEVRSAANATEVNGHRLAVALEAALAPGFHDRGQVHLIGHSFGSRVVSVAATAMAPPPRQVTLLDSPEVTVARLGGAMNGLQYVLPRLDVGRGEGQTFVDNYVSRLGAPYHRYPGLGSVVDVRTRPPAGSAGDQHGFAVLWYTDSVRDPSVGVGYGWSPFAGGDVTDVGAAYRQPDVDRPLALDRTDPPPPVPDPGDRLPVSRTPVPATYGGPADDADADDEGSPVEEGLVVAVDPSTTGRFDVATHHDSLWLELELAATGRPGDLVTVAVDGRARLQVAVTGTEGPTDGATTDRSSGDPSTDGPTGAASPRDAYVTLVDVAPGLHTFEVTVSGPTSDAPADPSTRVTVTDVELASTPGIVRNLTPRQTDWLVVGAAVLAGIVVVALALLVARLVRGVRHHRAGEVATPER